MKWFTSQIDILPGPKKGIVRYLGMAYEADEKDESRLAQESMGLKSRQLYGAYYQLEQKYVEAYQPSETFKSYEKGLKNEWNRNPNRPETTQSRQKLIYNSTRPY